MKNKIIPTQYYLLIQVRFEAGPENMIALPDSASPETAGKMPYGYVVAVGPDAEKLVGPAHAEANLKRFEPGDTVLFLPDNIVCRFDDNYAIIPASAVFARYVVEAPPKEAV